MPHVNYFCVFECHAKKCVRKVCGTKLNTRSKAFSFLEYTNTMIHYQFYDITTGQIFVSGNTKYYKFGKLAPEGSKYGEDINVFDALVSNDGDHVGSTINMKNSFQLSHDHVEDSPLVTDHTEQSLP